ncbi:lysozyme inhibitor LprI family protein [Acinetobacter seifertii]|uniref:lysozyme inhibitor LprI family protein n=1 Tax=Acinetobacter seifertii TaxID=1530123 RepID=UPI00083A93CE|nr:lysozyme inhibitor LprI family protein [Acinetobacter seifertii]OCZ58458.1 hypothetical protein A7P21_15320 [Acinetobacter seifertii]
MKKILLFTAISFFSVGVMADCNNPKTSHDIQQCLSSEITQLKKDLNTTYAKLYKQTDAKQELDNAQKAWLKYKDLQCGDFTVADAGYSSGQVAYDLACQAELIEQRISFLKNQLN